MHCLACDSFLIGEPRDREDFCSVCDAIITSLVMTEDILELLEIPFGLYEDWENEEKEESDEN